jgi:hypothetical protein
MNSGQAVSEEKFRDEIAAGDGIIALWGPYWDTE